MKKFYRFLRGELNGFYIQQVNNVLNNLTARMENFFITFKSLVFKLEKDVVSEETAISDSQLNGIGRFIGFLPPYSYLETLPYSLHFTTSNKAGGVEYSERGLYNIENEKFSFKRTTQETYNTDINTLATEKERTSLVELGASILGYFAENEEIIKADGTVDMSKLYLSPPVNKAYSNYYGGKYLMFNEKVNIYKETPADLYYEVLCILQQIRYNTPSIKTLCSLVEALCPGYLIIESYTWQDNYASLVYKLDENSPLDSKVARLTAFQLIMALKFNQIALQEE